MKNQKVIELLEKSAYHRAAARELRLKFEQAHELCEIAGEKLSTSYSIENEVAFRDIVDQCSQLSNGVLIEQKKEGAHFWGARNEFLASVEGTMSERDDLWIAFLEEEGFSYLA